MLDTPTTHIPALIFDTETSGLFRYDRRADQPGQPRMCALSAALLDAQGQLVSEFYQLIKPTDWEEQHIADCQMGTGAFAINGLSWERLNDEGIPPDHALMQYDALVDRCEGIAAYGVNFDQKVVRAEQRRAGRPDRYGDRPTFCINNAARDICRIPPTDKMMAAGRKTFKQPKLSEAVEIMLGRSHEDAHDAKADMMATVDIYRLMMQQPGLVVWKAQESKLQGEEA